MIGMDKPGWILIFRWLLFLAFVGGGIFFLAHYQQETPEKGEVAGSQVSTGGFPLVKKVIKVIPPQWQEEANQKLNTLIKKKKKENPWLEDVEKKVNQVEIQISQFPHQSQKEIKKQLIKQACQELLEEVDREK